MDAAQTLHALMTAIDEHRWHDLAQYLHDDFACELLHTGETFGREAWIAFNAGYPGFERLLIEQMVADADRAVCRSHVTCRVGDGTQHFSCASFAELRDGTIIRLSEVWADHEQAPPDGTRPAPEGNA